ncbi:MAG TPA: ABC transporter ATP-binding protein [Acidimicrobiales bacterium]|nr:ABC transporter ATP-binding protein [Acidimicrobiales bacterium]
MTVPAGDQQTDAPRQSVAGAVWSLIKAHKGLWLTSSLTASVLYYVWPLIPGLLIAALLDRLAVTPVLDGPVTRLLLILAGVYAMRGITLMVASVAENACLHSAATIVRRNLLAGILRRPAARALPDAVGDTLSRLNNDQMQVSMVHTWIADPIGQILSLCFALAVLARTDLFLTLVVAVPVVIAAAAAHAVAERVQTAREVLQRELGRRTGVLGDLFGGVASIQLGGAKSAAVKHLDRANERVRKAVLRDILIGESVQTFGNHVGEMGTALLLFLIAGRLRAGTLSVGDLAIFVSYVGRLSSVAGMAGWFGTQFRRARVSLVRLAELVPEEDPAVATRPVAIHLRGEIPEAAPPVRSDGDRLERLEVRGLTCLHGETSSGIRDLDLTISRGTVTVVTGEVGVGKTTLLRAVLGLLPVQRGEVMWNGTPVTPAEELVPPKVGYSPQVPRCFTASLAENIRLGHPADDSEIRSALHAAVMEDDLALLSDGLLTEIGPRGLRLSGGQLLRTAAARMFVRRPELMVVDDLSSGLDVDTEAELWRRLRAAGGTWLIVSHRPAALALADQILVLDDGVVAARGKPEDLASHPFIAHIRSGAPAKETVG